MHAHTDELTAFHSYVTEKLKTVGPRPSPEEVVDEWRDLHPEPVDPDEVAAIQEAAEDMKNGDRGRPFDEVMAELRAKYSVPSK
jgi:hypothetical protein